jgi:hypothetical protein
MMRSNMTIPLFSPAGEAGIQFWSLAVESGSSNQRADLSARQHFAIYVSPFPGARFIAERIRVDRM